LEPPAPTRTIAAEVPGVGVGAGGAGVGVIEAGGAGVGVVPAGGAGVGVVTAGCVGAVLSPHESTSDSAPAKRRRRNLFMGHLLEKM
jgi:hypothetical protein